MRHCFSHSIFVPGWFTPMHTSCSLHTFFCTKPWCTTSAPSCATLEDKLGHHGTELSNDASIVHAWEFHFLVAGIIVTRKPSRRTFTNGHRSERFFKIFRIVLLHRGRHGHSWRSNWCLLCFSCWLRRLRSHLWILSFWRDPVPTHTRLSTQLCSFFSDIIGRSIALLC